VLDRRRLAAPAEIPQQDEQIALLQEKGIALEARHLERLRESGRKVVEIEAGASLTDRVERTRAAMRAGVDVIYQGALLSPPWHGCSDFLALGPFGYEVAATKLSAVCALRRELAISHDDEPRRLRAFRLKPFSRGAGSITACGAFRNNALGSEVAGGCKYARTVAVDMVHEEDAGTASAAQPMVICLVACRAQVLHLLGLNHDVAVFSNSKALIRSARGGLLERDDRLNAKSRESGRHGR